MTLPGPARTASAVLFLVVCAALSAAGASSARAQVQPAAAFSGSVPPGGGVDGPAPFEFTVTFTVSEEQRGRLEVFEEDVSGGEGFPPPLNVIPVVLQP